MLALHTPAPEWKISKWLNTAKPISLEHLRGRVVVVYAFQMLCPGCVSHGLPQAKAIREAFSEADVTVIGLHTVFEHHDVMNEKALQTFLHEYRIRFPVGIDQADAASDIPLSMQMYRLRGTPSILIIDREGVLRHHHFGQLDDLRAGAMIGELLSKGVDRLEYGNNEKRNIDRQCDENTCSA